MIDEGLDRLALLNPADREAIGTVSAGIRQALEAVEIPGDLSAAITAALVALGEGSACAVRSSATSEDSPTASFAGQQDTYLNVVGPAAVLSHISRCWASLFTERAVIYRLHNGFDNRQARMAVIVQQMVFPQAAGVLFTADPVTSNRKLTSVEASFGLGEALVAGLASPDVYTVRDGDVVARAIATKRVAIAASPGGGTQEVAIEAERPAAAGADRRAGRRAGAARSADRGPLRPAPGHRMVPGPRRLSHRPEPPDHHAVPRPAATRPREPRLRLRRSSADDDRPHAAAGAVLLAADGGTTHVGGGREAVRRRRPAAGLADESRPLRRGPQEIRSTHRRGAGEHPRTRRFRRHPDGRGSGLHARFRRSGSDRDRPGHRHRADRARRQPPSPPCSATSGPSPDWRSSTSSQRTSRSSSGSCSLPTAFR